MTQLDLFPTSPISRPTDPPTSHEAAAYVERNLNRTQELMLAAFRTARKPITANEAAEECVAFFGRNMETYRKRKGELQRLGWIQCVGKRKCGVTGRSAEVFQVVR